MKRKILTLLAVILLLSRYGFSQQTLENRFLAIAQTVRGKVGVSALVIETGQHAWLNRSARFPMQSVYKIPISMAILDQVDKGRLRLGQPVHVTPDELIVKGHSPIRDRFPKGTDLTLRKLIWYNLVESDGSACDVLLRLLGGPAKAEQYIRKLGVNDMAIATNEMTQQMTDSAQYRNWCTPAAMTKLLAMLYQTNTLSPSSLKILLKDMTETPYGSERLKGLLPRGTVVAHKTGTSASREDFTPATNDVGIISLPNGRHLALAVFVSDAYGSPEEKDLIIAKMAKAVWDCWAR